MDIKTIVVCLVVYACHCAQGLPTVYKFNDNKVLEADLVPVSSTVIPLPVYQVGYGLHVKPSLHDEEIDKPQGPITLVTVHTKKKATEITNKRKNHSETAAKVDKKD